MDEKISDIDGDQKESRKEAAMNEALENLKRIYGDKVYGRIADFCTYTNKKYQIAMTKVSIVFYFT